MAFELKFSKFDNTPWGFRLTGGRDYGMPLTVVKVTDGSLSETIGLRYNDRVIKINNIDASNLTHDEAHEVIMQAGNNFIATIYREEQLPLEQKFYTNGFDTEMIPNPEFQNQLINDSNQVPIYGTQVTYSSKVYKPFFDTTFHDIPPLESPLILHPIDQMETIKHEEKMETLSESHRSRSATPSFSKITYEKSIIIEDIYDVDGIDNNGKTNTSTEICKKETQNKKSESKGVERNIEIVNEYETDNETVNEKFTEKSETKTVNKKEISSEESQTKKSEKCNIATKQENVIVNNNMETVKVSENTVKQEISLEDAKMSAISAASVLTQQAKQNGINTFEGTKMGTVNTFNTITENMRKHECLTLPCDAATLDTQSHTDMLLKTFFIHLTDVMIALTKMITCEDAVKCCAKSCSPYCTCAQNIKEKIMGELIQNRSIQSTQITEQSSSVESAVKKQETMENTSQNEQVLKEVIQNIHTATGVNVTVDGKDPLEWLAELDMKQNTMVKSIECVDNVESTEIAVTQKEVVQTEHIKSVDTEIVQSERIELAQSKELEKTQIKEVEASQITQSEITMSSTESQRTEAIEMHQVKSETTYEEKLNESAVSDTTVVTEQLSEATKEFNIDLNKHKKKHSQVSGKETVMSPGWDVKVIPNSPQTPNTDEYLFRLDVKLKGKLAKNFEASRIAEESTSSDETTETNKTKKPEFFIGNVDIENKIPKPTCSPSDMNTDETIDDKIKAKISEETKKIVKPTSLDIKKMYNNDMTDTTNASIEKLTESTNETRVDSEKLTTNTHSIDHSSNTNTAQQTSIEEANNINITDTKHTSSILEKSTITRESDSLASGNNFTSVAPASANSAIINKNIASVSGVITTAATATSALGQQGQEHESSVRTMKDTSMAMEQSESTQQAIIMEAEKMECTIERSEQSMIELSEKMVTEEVIAVESPPQVMTMGASAKNFATVNNPMQSMANGFEKQTKMEAIMCENEDIGKPGLPDEEIAEIISGKAMEDKEQHVIGLQKVIASHMNRPDDEINNTDVKEMMPVVGFLRDSEVFKALNEENLKSKAEKIQEDRRKYTTFLQKPNRPIPYCKRLAEQLVFEDPPYKVNIKKQPKTENGDENKSSILTEGVFLIPELPILIPEPTPQYYEAPEYLADSSFPDLEDTGIPLPPPVQEETAQEEQMNDTEEKSDETVTVENIVEEKPEQTEIENDWNEAVICDDTIDENLSMEEQLAKVQMQLEALSKLPATIQQTLNQVTKQLSKMVPKPHSEHSVPENGVDSSENVGEEKQHEETVVQDTNEEPTTNGTSEQGETAIENGTVEHAVQENGTEHIDIVESNGEVKTNGDINHSETVKHEEMISEEVTKVEEERKIEKLKKDLIDELNDEHAMRQIKQRPGGRVGRPRPAFGPLVPQERPIVLPGGRKWKGPKDAFTESFIAETLSGQAEVIMGKTLGNHYENITPSFNERDSNCHLVCNDNGVNFKKFVKPPVTLEHLKNSDVYKMIHDGEEQRPHSVYDKPFAFAESEFREKCRSITPTSFNKETTMEME